MDTTRDVRHSALQLGRAEDNWGTGRIGDSSFDARAGSVENMFDFHGPKNPKPVLLDPTTGAVVSKH